MAQCEAHAATRAACEVRCGTRWRCQSRSSLPPLRAIVLQSPGVSISAALRSSRYSRRRVGLRGNLQPTPSLMQELIDRKITQLPPPLMVMRSCLSGGLRGQRLPVWDSPGRYCHLAVAALKLRLGPNQKLGQYNPNELRSSFHPRVVCLFLRLRDADAEHFKHWKRDWIQKEMRRSFLSR